MLSPTEQAPSTAIPVREEVELLRRVRRLDLDAKVSLLTGNGDSAALTGEPRLGLRELVLTDGPQGVRGLRGVDPVTSLLMPAPSALGATWDVDLAQRVGGLFAAEAHRKGVHVVLAPELNLQRTPLAGRHFEYLSEDPLLVGALATGIVRGLQAQGVAACLKHFVANDSETDRTRYCSRLDERTLREVYLAPFEAAIVQADAWAVMTAYSAVDDGSEAAPASEHVRLLRDLLKGEWRFTGVVVSDWEGTRTTAESANGGLDLVMPGPTGPWGSALAQAVRSGEVDEALVDDKLLRLLRLASRVGRLTQPWEPGQSAPPERRADPTDRSDSDVALVREVAVRGMVLLRNEGTLLPLAPATLRRVALIGPNSVAPYFQGGGSAVVQPARLVGFVDGLRGALPAEVELTVDRGGDARRHLPLLDAGAVARDPESSAPGVRAVFLDAAGTRLGSEVRVTGLWGPYSRFPDATQRVVLRSVLTLAEPGVHRLEIGAIGRYRVLVDGVLCDAGEDDRGVEVILDSTSNLPDGRVVEIAGPREVELEVDLVVIDAGGFGRVISSHLRHAPPGPSTDEEILEAVAAARAADVAVVVVGTNEESESEGWDRTDLSLPGRQDELVSRVAAVSSRTIVVVNAGAPVLLPWADQVEAILWAWLPGQEAGHALADVLLGVAEPAGRLPWTMPARAEDVPVPHAIPVDGVVEYGEGVHVGYRGWDRAGLTPAYPFGHGLGWTTWSYDSLEAPDRMEADQGLSLKVRITNTGTRPAREVLQVYLEPPQDGLERPVRALAGFVVVQGEPGAAVTGVVTVGARAFQVWDAGSGSWRTPAGRYRLSVGRSSRDLLLEHYVTVGAS